MKKTIILMLGVASLASLNSCFKQEEDIFADSTAQRLEAANKANTEALTGAENGWVIEYFANENEPAYPILAKFDAHGGVTMAANNSVTTGGTYKEAGSTYSLGSDTGPILSFDTWNDVFSGFADPGSDGKGHLGDYEFVVTKISAAQDTIYLKGKKYGLNLRMVKFPMGAEYTAADGTTAKIEKWEDYYTAQAAVKSQLFSADILLLTAGNKQYAVQGMSSGIMSIYPLGGNAETQTLAIPYYLSLDGSVTLLSPYSGFEGNDGISVQTFRKDDTGVLKCVDAGQNAEISIGTPTGYFTLSGTTWRIVASGVKGEFKTAYTKMAADMRSAGYGRFSNLELKKIDSDIISATFKTPDVTATLYFNCSIADDSNLQLTFNREATAAVGSDDTGNGIAIYDDLASLRSFVEILSKKLTLTPDSRFNITKMTLTDASNAENAIEATLR